MVSRAGYLGPEGTFSEEALLSSAVPDSVEPVPQASIYDTIMALRHGDVEFALVPIENSLDGSISVTLDLLADEAPGLQIVGETLLTVRHCLIASQLVGLKDINTIISHPQVPGQCMRFLRNELAHADIRPASSTAQAVKEVVASSGQGLAALGTRLAADIYGATVIRDGVQDRDDNKTRFVWLSRSNHPSQPPLHASERGQWKTSLVFWGAGADSPGWLVHCLNELARREINLTKIESRPRRERLGHYMFFVDLEGSLPAEPGVTGAVAGMREICEEVRVLGSYPAA